MIQAGLAKGSDITSLDGKSPCSLLFSLTVMGDGREFLDEARDEGRWKKAMTKAGSFSCGVLRELLTGLAREAANEQFFPGE